MKVIRFGAARQEVDIQIEELTLLSLEEYCLAKNVIPRIHEWYWLRSPSADCSKYAGVAVSFGRGMYYNNVGLIRGVRPVLRIKNLEFVNLEVGDKFRLSDQLWTVISDNLALCDRPVGSCWFRKNDNAVDANIYERSDIKKWLEIWAENRIILEGAEQYDKDFRILLE